MLLKSTVEWEIMHKKKRRKEWKNEEGIKSKERKREKLAIQGKYNTKIQQQKHDDCQATKLGVPQGEWVRGEGSLSWRKYWAWITIPSYPLLGLLLQAKKKSFSIFG